MPVLSQIVILVVIALHLYFMLLEMALWKTKGPKIFGFSREYAESTAALASNQGLYNGFLVAALVLGLYMPAFLYYGLACVSVAGVWGGITVGRRIFYVQSVPALIALMLLWLKL